MPSATAAPTVSIVVGHRERCRDLPAALDAFAREADAEGGEVIVVDGSGRGEIETLAARHERVRVIAGTRGALMPTLWSEGIREARGEIIALSIASMVPRRGWLALVREVLERGRCSAVGGAIESAPVFSPVHWAIYFTRYSSYALPFEARDVDDLPGDNAAYRRDGLGAAKRLVDRAFWEPFVHALMRRDGRRLRLDPRLVTDFHPSFGVFEFLLQRFRHGRHRAASHLAETPGASRIGLIARAPLVPLVMYLRVVRRTVARRRHRARLLIATPALLLFFGAWAFGEKIGAIFGPGREPELDGALYRGANP